MAISKPDLTPMSLATVTVSAAANLALVKYWGKVDTRTNQPATASLSIGLEDLRTTTTLTFAEGGEDTFDADLNDAALARIRAFLDHVRDSFEVRRHFHVKTANNFPTGAGLASSASGFAALTLALNALLNLKLPGAALSQLARRGSGSAARSVYGGYVEVVPADDAWALPVTAGNEWPLDVVIAVTDEAPKPLGSTRAMIATAATSPFYRSWLRANPADMTQAKEAILARDFDKLAEVSERNCLMMHATIMAARPPVLYWLPATLDVMHRVRRWRASGRPAFFSIDAGPQVKVVCPPDSSPAIIRALDEMDGVRTLATRVGGAPKVHPA